MQCEAPCGGGEENMRKTGASVTERRGLGVNICCSWREDEVASWQPAWGVNSRSGPYPGSA